MQIIGLSWKLSSISIGSNLIIENSYCDQNIFDWIDNKVYFEELYPVDLNNDGRTNIVARQGNTNQKKWFITQGVSKQYLDLHNFWKGGGKRGELQGDYAMFIDYNGDGYQDLIIADDWRNNTYGQIDYSDYEKTMWYFYKNIGGKYILEFSKGGKHYFPKDNTNYAGLSRMNPVVMDINGDGIQDLVFGDRQGDRNNRYYKAFTMPGANKRNVVHSISNGMGQTDQFTYKYFSDYSKDAIDPSNPVRDLKAPVMIVDTYTDALGSKTSYTYANPKIHTEGKGFLGFETVTAINDVARTKTISTYEYDKTYYNVNLKHQETFTTTFGGILSSLDIINVDKPINEKRYIPQITKQTSVDYTKNITQNTNYLYNNDGTLQSQEIITGNNTLLTEYQNYKKRSDEGLVAYLPQKMVVTKKRNGMPDIVNVTNITYYENSGLLHTKTEAVGKYGETLTTYTYYPKGNVNTVAVQPKDIKESVTTYSYSGDSYFTFPSNVKTNTGGIDLSNISYSYDYTTGNVKTKTDNITNQNISYEYNSFGEKIKEIQPNGAVITYKTEWSNAQPNLVFKETVQSSSINHTEITYYDKYGREVAKTVTGWQGKLIVSSKSYNVSTGLLKKEIHPHYTGETEKYTTYNYGDYMNRLSSETFFDGINSLTTTYSYPYNSHIISVTSPSGQTKTTETDASGLVVKITDAGGGINYQYDANEQPLTISSNETTTSISYDEMGRQHKLIDPNAGTIEYLYYADGQLKQQISANGDITDIVYDDVGRLKTKTITNKHGGTPTVNVTTNYYVPNNENGAGQIDYIEQKFDGILTHKQDFTYNNHHQLSNATEIYDNQTITTSYEYDALWRPETTTSPSGLVTTNVYNEYGDIYQVKAGNKVIWEGKDQNSSGQWLKYTLGNGLQTNKTFTQQQETATIKTGIENNGTNNATIQNLSYKYDAPTGNLLTRNDLLNNRNETFTYDNLDRLLTAKLTGSTTYNFSMTYKPNGNIDTKSDVGTYQYNSSRPNAMSGISGIQAGVSTDKQFISYSTFNKVTEIKQGIDENSITKKYNIYYGLDEERIKSIYTDSNIIHNIRYYFGTYEKDIDKFGKFTQTDYIYTPAGLTAMVKNGTLYYVHTDNLGSIQAITDENKNIVSSYYYTPWGGRVLLSGANITDRGYTFHEHLEPFGLINMNGRVCDPVLARFLSPDNYVQAPDFTQSFNRYAYCLNNPFKYTDPSGEIVWFVPVIIGAVIGGVHWRCNCK